MISLPLRLGYKDFLRYELLRSMAILFILSKFLRYFSSLAKIFLKEVARILRFNKLDQEVVKIT
jgi:hypothetical protein